MPSQTVEKSSAIESKVSPTNSPRYRVLLHNDDEVDAEHVVECLMEITQLSQTKAIEVTITAHNTGVALIKTCDIEMAEFYVEALKSKGIPSSMEPEA